MPDWKQIAGAQLAFLGVRPEDQIEIAEELAQHLEDCYCDLLRSGADERSAREQALRELSDFAPLAEAVRRKSKAPPVEYPASGNIFADLLRDLRFALRSGRQSPMFTLFVVGTLALGIGANTTVFTVVNTLVLKPLPIPRTETLASIGTVATKNNRRSAQVLPVSLPNMRDLAARTRSFRSLAGYSSPRVVTARSGGESNRMFAEVVTGAYFATLGLQPARGRFFALETDNHRESHAVAVMNYATWQGRYAGAPDIIGKKLVINNIALTVIGVAPPRFLGVDAIFGPDLWVPASLGERLIPNEMAGILQARSKALFQVVARLKPHVSLDAAKGDVAAAAASLAREFPDINEGHTLVARTITEAFFGTAGGRSPVVFAGFVLLAVVGLVLLIACSNVANLLLARSAARQGELAVRMAIGASRGRLIRQLLAESLLLAILGGAAGFALGYTGTRVLWSSLPGEVIFNLRSPQTDMAVLAYTLLVSVLTALVFGAAPALRASRLDVIDRLKEQTRTAGRSRRRVTFANSLLVGQVALSFLSIVVAALFLRSMERAYGINPGYQTFHLALFSTNPGQAGFDEAQTRSFYKQVRQRVDRLPGVAVSSWSSNLPLWASPVTGIDIAGRAQRSRTDRITAVLNTIDSGYFDVMNISVQHGRSFAAVDEKNGAPVAVVNEKMAGDYWTGSDAIGKRIRLPGESFERQIVGVVANANYSSLAEAPQPCIYVPALQKYNDAMNLYIKSKGDPQSIMNDVRREIRAVLPEITVADVRSGRTVIEQSLFTARLGVAMLSIFGLLALGLASIGLYGIMALAVNLRQQEIGIRIALGAHPSAVLSLVLQEGMRLVLVGLTIGSGLSVIAGQLLSGLLYGINITDPISFGAASGILLCVAMAACLLPAFRATRVDPLSALRTN